jgi:hypothetical protein
MAKKNKIIQLQSPENYIRTRARNLEIFECLVSNSWESDGIANVVIARKHTNGNVTFAVYLVDLYCLGVKDTMYIFNIGEYEYREKLKPFNEMSTFTEIDYNLAHNIIFAAIEFAGDFGFNPHKTFTSVTQYMLEEDTDEIDIIDIVCGLDGKPAYFKGADDSQATVNRILKQLEQTAGKGNYDFVIEPEDGFNVDDFVAQNEGPDDDEVQGMNFSTAVDVFKKYEANFNALNEFETRLFLQAVTVIFSTKVDDVQYDMYSEEFLDSLDIEIETGEFSHEMLGLSGSSALNISELNERIMRILELPDKKANKALRRLADLKQDYPGIPFIPFLEIYFDKERYSVEFKKKLEKLTRQFPEYSLLTLFADIDGFIQNQEGNARLEPKPINEFFPGRDSIHEFEMQQYLMHLTLAVIAEANLSKLAALQDALFDSGLPDELTDLLMPLIITEKIQAIYTILGIPL